MLNIIPASFVRRCAVQILIVITACTLSACGGGSSKSSPSTSADRSVSATPSDTTDKSPASENSNDSGSNSGTEANALTPYSRPVDYPSMVTLPVQFITTPTGEKLAAYVSLPSNGHHKPATGPFPVILSQSAYNLSLSGAVPMTGGVLTGGPDPYLVRRGYVVVGVDVLGSGLSSGGWNMLGPDEHAGYAAAVDWVKQQPWFNGKLGLAGASYMAITSLFSAELRPDDVQAIFAGVPMGDAERGTVGTGGILNGLFMSTWMVLTQMLTTQNIPAMLRFPRYYNLIAANTQQHVDQIDNYFLPLITKAINGDPEIAYDSDFWRSRSPLENIDKITAPTIIFGGLDDIFQRDEPLLYEQLKKNTDARLIIFDGDHLNAILNAYPGGDHVEPMMHMMLQWFDHYLMGMDTGIANIPPVTQYVRNYSSLRGYGYATTTDWPHPDAQAERWYLHGDDMGLDQTMPESEETTHTMDAAQHADIAYGKNPSGGLLEFSIKIHDGSQCSKSFRQWTLGGAGVLKAPKCYFYDGKVEANALNYESAPLPDDYYINGPIEADIWISSTKPDAVLSVRVDDVGPKGKNVEAISNGLLLASGRAVDPQRSRYMDGQMIQPYHYFSQESEQMLEPDQVVEMRVEIFPTSVLIRKGHRLRISLSPSNQAQGILNLKQRENVDGGVTTVYTTPEYPSSVVLPVVPVSDLN